MQAINYNYNTCGQLYFLMAQRFLGFVMFSAWVPVTVLSIKEWASTVGRPCFNHRLTVSRSATGIFLGLFWVLKTYLYELSSSSIKNFPLANRLAVIAPLHFLVRQRATRDFLTFLKLGPGACWIWENIVWAIKIGKTRFSLKEQDFHFKLSDLKP